jgi:IS605 OrfB family transposase
MDDFRLLTNQCLRHALEARVTSRGALSRFARTQALDARLTGAIGLAAADVARSLAAGHRTRLRNGVRGRIPYVRTPFARIPAQSFHFNLETGKLRFSLRRCEWSSVTLPTSAYLRNALSQPGRRVTQVHIGLRRAVFVFAERLPEPYAPSSAVALDTNESSLDGVRIDSEGAVFVRVLFPELRAIQARHVGRRRCLGRKKAHDRRMSRRLLRREGWRERHRIRSRLHDLTRSLVDRLAADHSALILEDLKGMTTPRRGRSEQGKPAGSRSRSLRRRLSQWPRKELHRQLTYKAQDRGVPIVWVDPYRTSRTCPRCGEVSKHRRRVGTKFDCVKCGWSCDRQLNAGLNLGAAALRTTAGLGGLRLDPEALPHDVVRPLYGLANDRPARVERMEREGTCSKSLPSREAFE